MPDLVAEAQKNAANAAGAESSPEILGQPSPEIQQALEGGVQGNKPDAGFTQAHGSGEVRSASSAEEAIKQCPYLAGMAIEQAMAELEMASAGEELLGDFDLDSIDFDEDKNNDEPKEPSAIDKFKAEFSTATDEKELADINEDDTNETNVLSTIAEEEKNRADEQWQIVKEVETENVLVPEPKAVAAEEIEKPAAEIPEEITANAGDYAEHEAMARLVRPVAAEIDEQQALALRTYEALTALETAGNLDEAAVEKTTPMETPPVQHLPAAEAVASRAEAEAYTMAEAAQRTAENLGFDEPDQTDTQAVEDQGTYAEVPNTSDVEFATEPTDNVGTAKAPEDNIGFAESLYIEEQTPGITDMSKFEDDLSASAWDELGWNLDGSDVIAEDNITAEPQPSSNEQVDMIDPMIDPKTTQTFQTIFELAADQPDDAFVSFDDQEDNESQALPIELANFIADDQAAEQQPGIGQAEETLAEETLAEEALHITDEEPLEDKLRQLAVSLTRDNSEASDEAEAQDGVPADLTALGEAMLEQIGFVEEGENKIQLTPEITEELLKFIENLGYQDPHEELIKFVDDYSLNLLEEFLGLVYKKHLINLAETAARTSSGSGFINIEENRRNIAEAISRLITKTYAVIEA